jgi:hypothetical protein
MTFSWDDWVKELRAIESSAAAEKAPLLDAGQRCSLDWMSSRLPKTGLVLADEVGTGKTRIACAVVHAVLMANGRAAVVVPHGLLHQWQDEAKKLGMPLAKTFTSVSDFIEKAKDLIETDKWKDITPNPKKPEWLLISHGFRAPQVRQGKNLAEWRVALPSYVLAQLSSKSKQSDRRTQAGKLLDDPHEVIQRISEEIAARFDGADKAALRNRLEALPHYRRNGDNNPLASELQNGGREVVERLLGYWLGEFDLIVIDEAHKSRSEIIGSSDQVAAVSGSVLSRLIDCILRQPDAGRRLCLTATPMELDLSQWLDLLNRARCGVGETEVKAIEEFQKATSNASIAPDESARLDCLIAASTQFQAVLEPFVTRRRRNEDGIIREFSSSQGPENGKPHPHRRMQSIPIGWDDSAEQRTRWMDILFAAECMSKSAIGLTRQDTEGWPHAVRDAYTKLSAGHFSPDLCGEGKNLIPEAWPKGISGPTRDKIARTAYWFRKLCEGRNDAAGSGFNPDADHPRITSAVKEIEYWTLQQEKVLVFGVFLGPLKLLRDVLNVRHALRAADAGRPIAHAVHRDAALCKIALRQLNRLRVENALNDRLKEGNCDTMLQMLEDSHKAYEPLRERVRKRAVEEVKAWRSDQSLLGGLTEDGKLDSALVDLLLGYVLEVVLTEGLATAEITERERFKEMAKKFFDERLSPFLSEPGTEIEDDKQATRALDALRVLTEDVDSRQSLHARLLQGDTRWETRRYLQAAFNSGYSPQVLIAQSQVGREGLNLHKACRVVVQFHAEWNPAILEQQIGRVDRKGSCWEQMAKKWLAAAPSERGEPPFIEVKQLLFEGTYDAFQWGRVERRLMDFDASLFGTLLPPEHWDRISDESIRQGLIKAAPDFSPKCPKSK